MTRRTKHELIVNTTKRNKAFDKRTQSLVKKANELSILCGVNVGLIVHNREANENNVVLWPSPPAFNELLERFVNTSNAEKVRKMETHETSVLRAIREGTENLSKAKTTLEMTVSRQLLAEVTKGKDMKELDLQQLKGLALFAEEMLKKVQKRRVELNADLTNVASTSNVAPQN